MSAKATGRQAAQHHLKNFAGFLREPVTGWVRERSAAFAYERALTAVAAVEDAVGVDAAWPLIQRLRGLYFEARETGLLSTEDICAVEARVFA